MRPLAAVFDAHAVSAASPVGWAHIVGALAGAAGLAWAVAVVVGRLKKAVDHVASAYLLHAAACTAWAGALPDTPAWWLSQGLAFIVAATLAEYLCLRREAREILLGSGGGGSGNGSSVSGRGSVGVTSSSSAASVGPSGVVAPSRRGPGVASPPPPPPLAAAGATPALSAWAAASTARAAGPSAAAAADGDAGVSTPPRSTRPGATSLYAALAQGGSVFRFVADAEGEPAGARATGMSFTPFGSGR